MQSILVVEDDKFLGREIKLALEAAKYSVNWAKDGDEALGLLKQQAFDLVFLDIMMPGTKNGYVVLSEMKQIPELKDIKVVMLSNLGQMNEIDRAMELGASDYIVKANMDLDKLADLTRTKYLV